jgi:hypothetical protein
MQLKEVLCKLFGHKYQWKGSPHICKRCYVIFDHEPHYTWLNALTQKRLK